MRRALLALLCCGAAAPLALRPAALASWWVRARARVRVRVRVRARVRAGARVRVRVS